MSYRTIELFQFLQWHALKTFISVFGFEILKILISLIYLTRTTVSIVLFKAVCVVFMVMCLETKFSMTIPVVCKYLNSDLECSIVMLESFILNNSDNFQNKILYRSCHFHRNAHFQGERSSPISFIQPQLSVTVKRQYIITVRFSELC